MVKISGIEVEEAMEIVKQKAPKSIAEYLNSPYTVSEKQKKEYWQNGFIKLENVLEEPALAYIRRVIGAAVMLRKEKDKRTLAEKSQYEQSFMQCGYLCWDFPAVKEFVFGKRFAGIARDLMGAEGIRLWHDQALYKEPGGRITDMHQDISYWPLNTEFTITMWLALVDVPPGKGNMYFVPGSHKSGLIEYVDIFKNPHTPESLQNSEKVPVQLKAGDATFHSGLTFHGAMANETAEMREAMTVIYIADGTCFDATDTRNATHTSCHGLQHDDVIDTKYTPRLV